MTIYEKITLGLSIVATLCSIFSIIYSIIIWRKTAILTLKSDYERIINYCNDLAKTNDIKVRLDRNLNKKPSELTLMGELFGEDYVKRFNNFACYNTPEFENFIKSLEEKYKKGINFAKKH